MRGPSHAGHVETLCAPQDELELAFVLYPQDDHADRLLYAVRAPLRNTPRWRVSDVQEPRDHLVTVAGRPFMPSGLGSY